jgi:hypothetical protein
LFIQPLDQERAWYRYRPPFGDLLRARLQQTRTAEVPRLHQRAVGESLKPGMAALVVLAEEGSEDLIAEKLALCGGTVAHAALAEEDALPDKPTTIRRLHQLRVHAPLTRSEAQPNQNAPSISDRWRVLIINKQLYGSVTSTMTC